MPEDDKVSAGGQKKEPQKARLDEGLMKKEAGYQPPPLEPPTQGKTPARTPLGVKPGPGKAQPAAPANPAQAAPQGGQPAAQANPPGDAPKGPKQS